MGTSARNETPKGGPKTFNIPPSGAKLIGTIPHILPHERVFPIQIGCDLFKLSGASISSDAPSYFSQYFQSQIKQAEEAGQDISSAIRTLYIDRDPVTFKDISLHLQGYHIKPRDGQHFVRLFADAQFYTLPKLMSQLYEESIFVAIGGHEFQIDRDLFKDQGNSPNFFSLGFAAFFSSPGQIFPGLERENLIRPPSIVPPGVSNKSAEIFNELVQLLRGYPVHIRNEAHRASLLKDCRYFNFKAIEQKLIPHSISYNQLRGRTEIVLRIEDLLKSGISVFHEGLSVANLGAPLAAASLSPSVAPTTGPGPGSSMPASASNNNNNASSPFPAFDPSFAAWVNYARPFEDSKPHDLVLEISGEVMTLHTQTMRAEFYGSVKTRVSKLFEVVASKLRLSPTTQPLGLLRKAGGSNSQPTTPGSTPISEELVRVVIEPDAHIMLNGRVLHGFPGLSGGSSNSTLATPTAAEDEDMMNAMSASASFGSNGHALGGGTEDSPISTTGGGPLRKRRRMEHEAPYLINTNAFTSAGNGGIPDDWVIRTGQWRLRIQSPKNNRNAVECVFVAVKVDAYTSELARNAQRGFLTAAS